MKKNLCQYLLEGDYAGFLRFVHSSAVHSISETDAISFYEQADENWVIALLQEQSPSSKVEKVIIKYNSSSVVEMLYRLWKFYPATIEWAFRQENADVTEKVLNCLEDKSQRPSEEAEVAFVKQGNDELFKLYLEKFGELTDGAEKVLNEDPMLYPLLSTYIDYMS